MSLSKCGLCKCWAYPQSKSNESSSCPSTLYICDDEEYKLCYKNDGYKIILCDNFDKVKLVEMILIFCFNVVLFAFIVSNRRLRIVKSNKMFLNLLITHVILSITGFMSIFYTGDARKIEVVINNGILMEMFLSLMITTGDRFIAIEYPYTYETLTSRKTLQIILLSWTMPIIFVILGITLDIEQKQSIIISTLVIAVAAFVLTATNLRIYAIARRHAEALNLIASSKVLKSTYVCFAIVFSFVILWLPVLVHNMLVLTASYRACYDKPFTKIVIVIAQFNSVLDPILFIIFRKNVKKELKRILHRHGLVQFNEKKDRKSGLLQGSMQANLEMRTTTSALE